MKIGTPRSRVISGSASSLIRLAMMLLSQLLSVPIFLSKWSNVQYGYWILFLTLTPLVQIFDQAFQTYIGNKCLKIGPERSQEVNSILSSALLIQFVADVLILSALCALLMLEYYSWPMINPSEDSFYLVLLIVCHWVGWMMLGAPLGLLARALACYGFFPRFNWWSLFVQSLAQLTPILFVILGYGFIKTGIATVVCILIGNLFIFFDALFIAKKINLRVVSGDFRCGLQDYKKSQFLALTIGLDMLRQQGIRLLIAPVLSVRELIEFTTIRTGANLAFQGLAALTQPLIPELMNFVRSKSQFKINKIIIYNSLVSVVFLGPSIVILQAVVPYLYSAWTLDRMIFDPILFAIFSITIVVYATYQPSLLIVQGNNMVREQFLISIIVNVTMLILAFIGIQMLGLRGIALALMLSEMLAAILYVKTSNKWLRANLLTYPKHVLFLGFSSAVFLSAAIFVMVLVDGYKLLIIMIYLAVASLSGLKMWKSIAL